MLLRIFSWFFIQALVVEEKSRSLAEIAVAQMCIDDSMRESIHALLASADLGISGIETIEEELSSFTERLNLAPDYSVLHSLIFPRSPRAVGGVQFRHRATSTRDGISLPFEQESEGTKALFTLAGLIVGRLRQGGLLMVDELDRSLHPHLALKIVAMFNDPATNPGNAQLVFNTHDTNLLDTNILRRDQIWFTEKGDDGATRLYPLTDFRARKHENLERGYLQGRYGAVPAVSTPDLGRAVGE